MRSSIMLGKFGWMLVVASMAEVAPAAEPLDFAAQSLPGTQLLQLDEPLHEVMVRGISRFAERELLASREKRTAPWLPKADGTPATMTIEQARQQLKTLIGAVEPPLDAPAYWTRMDAVASEREPERTLAWMTRWEVAEGIGGEAVTVVSPFSQAPPQRVSLVLISDPDQSLDAVLRTARMIAADGHDVHVPLLIDRNSTYSQRPGLRSTNLPHREFVYRTNFELGRHVVGYEVQRVLALSTVLRRRDPGAKIVLAGVGEGGLLALLSAAADPEAIDAVAVCGYFAPREGVWQEPIYRNIWSQLKLFGDAEIASLVAPRPLIIEAGPAPEVSGPPPTEKGRFAAAAPGVIRTPSDEQVDREFQRAKRYFERAGAEDQIKLIDSDSDTAPSRATLLELLTSVGANLTTTDAPSGEPQTELTEWLKQRQKTQLDELIRHSQRLLHRSDKERAKFWSKADRGSLEKWVNSSGEYREYIHREMIGQLPRPTAPPNPRSRKVIDEPTHVGYEVVLDVYPDQQHEGADIIAGGILLLPRDLKGGEKRPVVVCQHGLEGTPMDTITTDPSERAWRAYKGFSTQLVKQGFIVYAPQNPYKGQDDFRVIQRKSNPLGRSLFSYIIEQHRQTLKWLATLPYVDRDRIGFYGLSYGGKTAVRVPPLLPPHGDEPGYCLSICSADFNEWIRKNVSSEDRYSYVFTGEYEMFEWNMGHVADYAELSTLMTPRPFMVERGHDDGVAPDEWVAWEYAKVRRHYDQLGIGERTEIEWFNGPHTINGEGTFQFLKRHLDWRP